MRQHRSAGDARLGRPAPRPRRRRRRRCRAAEVQAQRVRRRRLLRRPRARATRRARPPPPPRGATTRRTALSCGAQAQQGARATTAATQPSARLRARRSGVLFGRPPLARKGKQVQHGLGGLALRLLLRHVTAAVGRRRDDGRAEALAARSPRPVLGSAASSARCTPSQQRRSLQPRADAACLAFARLRLCAAPGTRGTSCCRRA